jgi:probable DNA metabolism protein
MKTASWVYDGSLEGLLVLVDRAMAEGEGPSSVLLEGRAASGLFEVDVEEPAVRADPQAADEAARRILAHSRRLYAAALRAWMAEEEVEADLLTVAADCAARGDTALGDYSQPTLSRLAASVRRVSREVHLLEGFARFAPLRDGRFVARLEPVHNVLPALAPFFLGRFGADPFALVDLRRRYGLCSRPGPDGPRLELVEGEALAGLEPDDDDREAIRLWQGYFRIVENQSRHNPALQRRLMPVRYWRQLSELGGDPGTAG